MTSHEIIAQLAPQMADAQREILERLGQAGLVSRTDYRPARGTMKMDLTPEGEVFRTQYQQLFRDREHLMPELFALHCLLGRHEM